jgi:DNA replication protein DnaC
MRNVISEKLKELRLSGVTERLEMRIQEARANRLDYPEFLEIMLDDELMERANKKMTRALKAANFRSLKTLEEFDWQFNPNIDRALFFELATGQFIRDGRDLLMVGPPGTGKTCLAQAIGYEAIKQGFAVIYCSVFDLVRDLHFPASKREATILNKYLKCDLLIIDDMGLKCLPENTGEHLFEIVMRRFELKSIIMTSNRPIEDWGQLVGDIPIAGAILDRLLQGAQLIPFKGKSYRMRQNHSQ